MTEDDDAKGYRWETEYERTWEAIHENEDGLLQPSVDEIVHKARRKRLLDKRKLRLGMMRHLFVIVDCSEVMQYQDLKPNRQLFTLKLLEKFVDEYFDQNPISQLGFISTKSKKAEKLSELAGNPKKHIEVLRSAVNIGCEGEPSLQNSLELAFQTLRSVPSHTSKEIVIILGSLTTCDPGDIYETIEMMKSNSIRCSVIGLTAELHVCRALTKATKGNYDVILDESHFRELIYQHICPPPASNKTESSMIRMGFPHHQSDQEGKPSLCNCHLGNQTLSEGFGSAGYFCPQCGGKYCELPVECRACGLTLVSAPQLARSYHHLFALDAFQEVNLSSENHDMKLPIYCYGCMVKIESTVNMYRCYACQEYFCLECDLFIHDTLHTCPGCTSQKKSNVM